MKFISIAFFTPMPQSNIINPRGTHLFFQSRKLWVNLTQIIVRELQARRFQNCFKNILEVDVWVELTQCVPRELKTSKKFTLHNNYAEKLLTKL